MSWPSGQMNSGGRASDPQDLPRLLIERLNSGDADAVAALYESEGVVAPDPAQVVAGREAIKSMATAFLAQEPRFLLHDSEVVQAGDLALVRSRLTVTVLDAARTTTESEVEPTLVARRQPDGYWLVVIDRPS